MAFTPFLEPVPLPGTRTVMERGRGELYLATPEKIQQRAALLLRDVRYVIDILASAQPGLAIFPWAASAS